MPQTKRLTDVKIQLKLNLLTKNLKVQESNKNMHNKLLKSPAFILVETQILNINSLMPKLLI